VNCLKELERELKARIGRIPPERIVFVGIGNRSRGDDAIGPMVADMLAGRVPHAIDAGPSPENLTSTIKKLKPEAIVFIDALIFKELAPGVPQIVEIDDIRHLGESTHTLSLDVVMEYLMMETGADVLMIGVQPGRIENGEGLSPGMREAIEKIADIIINSMNADR
jgi:hydrogenase maturation protease HycI